MELLSDLSIAAGIRETNDRVESIGIKKAYEKAEKCSINYFSNRLQ